MSQIFKYAMVNRPAGLGTVPRDGFIGSEERPKEGWPHYIYARNGVALFSRELTDVETKSFELASMNEADISKSVRAVADLMSNHAAEYLNASENDPSFFNGKVFEFHRKSAIGYPVSIGDFDAFRGAVIASLGGIRAATAGEGVKV
jgi:Defence against restriction A C-terminal